MNIAATTDATESSTSLRIAGHVLSAAIVVATIIVGLYVARLYYLYPRTDDAYVRANSVGIAPHVSGPITELPIVDNQYVKQGAMLFVVVMGSAWSVALATDTGARTIPRVYARAARTMGSEGFHQWTRVILPASLPYLISGMKQGWAFAWRSLMAAEIFVTILTGFGLGQLLHYGRELNAMEQVIGIMIVIVLIGLLADKALFAPWERFLHRRWGTGSAAAT